MTAHQHRGQRHRRRHHHCQRRRAQQPQVLRRIRPCTPRGRPSRPTRRPAAAARPRVLCGVAGASRGPQLQHQYRRHHRDADGGDGQAVYTVTASNTGAAPRWVSPSPSTTSRRAGTIPTNPASYVKGTAIATTPPATRAGRITAYSVSPALPAGLSLNPTTGVITGTPTAVTATASYTVTGTNTGGSTTVALTLTVNDAHPTRLTYSSNPATYVKGTAIATNTPPAARAVPSPRTGVAGLPAGPEPQSHRRGVITGTPTAVAATASYTVTGSNVTGSTTVVLSSPSTTLRRRASPTPSIRPSTRWDGHHAQHPSSTGGAIMRPMGCRRRCRPG